MRALQRLRVPTLVFVNKIDRAGADDERVLRGDLRAADAGDRRDGVRRRELGTRAADFTPSSADDAAFRRRPGRGARRARRRAPGRVRRRRARHVLARGCATRSPRRRAQALVHPVFFGSAITGAGVDALMAGIAELLPAPTGDADGPVSGTVFKIERGPARRAGSPTSACSPARCARATGCTSAATHEEKVTAISVFERGDGRPAAVGLGGRDRQALGPRRDPDRRRDRRRAGTTPTHAVPAADAGVGRRRRVDADDSARLRVALAQLAEQDPLINVRQDDTRQELSVSLYGEVQKEVIQATLGDDFGIEVDVPRDDADLHRAARSAPARRSRSSTRSRIRSSPRSGCASIRRPAAPGSSSGSRSTRAPSRSTSTRRSRASRSTWTSTSARRCRRASSAGRSPTAS